MEGYITKIEKETLKNVDYRHVLYTTDTMQLVLMSIESGDDIGMETHHLSQFIRIEKGVAKVIMDGESEIVESGSAFIIPAGIEHNVVNIGEERLKLYSIYAPPEHKDGIIHHTKKDAKEEHFDGVTSL